MKLLHRYLLTAGLLASVGLAAVAQTQTPPAPPAGQGAPHTMQREHGRMDPARMERIRARMEERMARRLGELKQKLQISRGQESAWDTWTAAIKPTRFQRPDRAAIARLTTPERIDHMKALRAQRGAEMDKRLDATKGFYAQLNAEQQKVFDQEGLRFLRRMGGKRGHFGGHHHGHHG
jgi:periplasmic protein CpxP/Spy